MSHAQCINWGSGLGDASCYLGTGWVLVSGWWAIILYITHFFWGVFLPFYCIITVIFGLFGYCFLYWTVLISAHIVMFNFFFPFSPHPTAGGVFVRKQMCGTQLKAGVKPQQLTEWVHTKSVPFPSSICIISALVLGVIKLFLLYDRPEQFEIAYINMTNTNILDEFGSQLVYSNWFLIPYHRIEQR